MSEESVKIADLERRVGVLEDLIVKVAELAVDVRDIKNALVEWKPGKNLYCFQHQELLKTFDARLSKVERIAWIGVGIAVVSQPLLQIALKLYKP